MHIKVHLISDDARVPKAANFGDGGADLVATSVSWNPEYGFYQYETDVCFEVPEGYFGLLVPRSSLSKYDLSLCNHAGILDSSYRGSVSFRYKPLLSQSPFSKLLRFMGWSREERLFVCGEKIGQVVLIKDEQPTYIQGQLNKTTRGEGSYGSTGA